MQQHFVLSRVLIDRDPVAVTHLISLGVPPANGPATRSKSPPNILLVDDDPVFGRIFTRRVKSAQAAITVCQTMDELAPQLRSRFDVAILDFDLGAITGIELSNYLASYFPMLPILIISDNHSPDIQQKSDQVCGFVRKALGAEAILAAALASQANLRGHHRPVRTADPRRTH